MVKELCLIKTLFYLQLVKRIGIIFLSYLYKYVLYRNKNKDRTEKKNFFGKKMEKKKEKVDY